MILAHLVGDQTLPNLLAALALRPDRIVHLASADKKFLAPIRNLERALALTGLKPAFHTLTLPSLNPVPSEVSAALTTLPANWQPSVLNLTGGTKLMSLGAHTWAELNHVPSLYVDTGARSFIPTSSLPLPEHTPLTEVAATLTLEIVLTAHGVPADKIQGTAPSAAALAFGDAAALAWRQNPTDCATFVRTLAERWFHPMQKHVLPDAWRTAVAIPSSAAPSALAQAAAQAGLATIDDLGRLLPKNAADHTQRAEAIRDLHQNLEGGWLELHLASAMFASGRFHDLRWSVQSPERPDLGLGENDLVALDRLTLAPVFVSCKSSTAFAKPLEHIFSLRQRALHFGGTFAKAVLCIERSYSEEQETQIKGFCRAANVQLHLGPADFAKWLQP